MPSTAIEKDLVGKVALVTGGSRGIGRACCIALACEDCAIAVNYVRSEKDAEDVVAALRGMGVKARSFQADISKEDQTNVMIEQIMKEFGRVDVLVNNAGITQDKSFRKMTRDLWHKVLVVNLDGAFNVTSGVLDQMCERGWGRIINMTSIVAQMGNFGQSNYAVAKGGLIGFTKALAREVAAKGVTVNAVAPGFIETDMTASVPAETLELVKKLTPMGRLGKPEEVARAVRFLSAPQASFITGQVININGGMYM
ncbi:MAG: 3-oxoacyl-ACP reductase FabG [Phycisphaerales bacterium]|nr:3-oxoacyl-ACP reductase FabG [Phycisphaerales bacterium]